MMHSIAILLSVLALPTATRNQGGEQNTTDVREHVFLATNETAAAGSSLEHRIHSLLEENNELKQRLAQKEQENVVLKQRIQKHGVGLKKQIQELSNCLELWGKVRKQGSSFLQT